MTRFLTCVFFLALLGFQTTTAKGMNETDKSYTAYGNWSECTASCGGGLSFRVKECDDLTGNPDCEKSAVKECNTQPCDTKEKEYTSYTSWSECTASCGGGFSYRVRECKDLSGDEDCEKSKRKPCNEQPCIANNKRNVSMESEDVSQESMEILETKTPETTVVVGGFDITSEGTNKVDSIEDSEMESSMIVVEGIGATISTADGIKPTETKETKGSMVVVDEIPATVSTFEEIKPTEIKESAETSKKYVDYSKWSECTVSCGGGFSYRVRECEELSGDEDCEKSERKACNEVPCSTDTEPQPITSLRVEPEEKEAILSETEGEPELDGLIFNIVEGEVEGREIIKIPIPQSTKIQESPSPTLPTTASAETRKVVMTTTSPKLTQKAQKLKDCVIEMQASNEVQQFVPKNLGKNLSCDWIIKAKEGKQIMAQIHYFNQNHCCDKFQIYDGENLLVSFNGTKSFREKYITKSDRFKISFQGRIGEEYRNFRVFYTNYPVSTPATTPKSEIKLTRRPEIASSGADNNCDRTFRVTRESQEFDSGIFKKHKKYECMWRMTAPGGGIIKAKIMYYSTTKCCAYMEVYDGSKLLKRYNGAIYVRGEDFTIESGLLMILYKNPAMDGHSRIRAYHRLLPAKLVGTVLPQNNATPGFTRTTETPTLTGASVKPITSSKQTVRASTTSKPSIILTSKFTTSADRIYSIGMPLPTKSVVRPSPVMCLHTTHAMNYIRTIYGPYVKENESYNCEWKVTAPKGKSVQTMIYFYKTVDCDDYLQVFDGDKLLAKFNGNYKQQQEFKTRSNTLILKYMSSDRSRGRRFRALYKIRQTTHTCGTTLAAKGYVMKYESPYFEQGKPYDCEWSIRGPAGSRLRVQLYYYNTAHCCDIMKVKEGNRILDVISTKTYSHTIYTTKSNNLKLRFTSGGGYGARRFVVYYIVEPGVRSAMYSAHPIPRPEISFHNQAYYHPRPRPEYIWR